MNNLVSNTITGYGHSHIGRQKGKGRNVTALHKKCTPQQSPGHRNPPKLKVLQMEASELLVQSDQVQFKVLRTLGQKVRETVLHKMSLPMLLACDGRLGELSYTGACFPQFRCSYSLFSFLLAMMTIERKSVEREQESLGNPHLLRKWCLRLLSLYSSQTVFSIHKCFSKAIPSLGSGWPTPSSQDKT